MKIKNCDGCVKSYRIYGRDDVVVCMRDMILHSIQEQNDCFCADKCETCAHAYTCQSEEMNCTRMDAGLSCRYEERSRDSVAIKKAETIAEYVIRKWLKEEGFALGLFILEMNGNEGTLKDHNGESLVLVYDPDEKSVYIKGFGEG